jgi:23S rRNA (adenine2030-N6)-methyltransferase
MQYKHSFHAGNFADVHKHVALLALIAALQRKAKGFQYVDTHGGGGLYDLRGEEARRGAEAQAGVERLLASTPQHAEITDYLAQLARIRAITGAHSYPGSPLLATSALREVDRAICVEVVAQESRHLQRSLDAIAALVPAAPRVEAGDGYQRLIALLPPRERRALVLIDPPYESADEYTRILAVIPEALRRLDGAVIAVWFPVKRARDTDLWLAKLARVVQQPMLTAQLWLHPRDSAAGLNGSGLVVVNPPWQFDTRAALWQEELRELLGGTGSSGSEVKWLVHEHG